MNEINNQYGYISQISQNNPYVDYISFYDTGVKNARAYQISYVFKRFQGMSEIVDLLDPHSPILTKIRAELTQHPTVYGTTANAFLKSYYNSMCVMSDMAMKYNKTDKVDDVVFKKGFYILNEKLQNDLKSGKLSISLCVKAFAQMEDSLQRIAPKKTQPPQK